MSTNNERIDFARRSLDGFWSDYDKPEIKERVDQRMRSLGFSAAVLDLVLNPETYVAYNPSDIKASSLLLGPGHSIGVIALRTGETVRLDLDSHPIQRTNGITEPSTLTYPRNSGAVVFYQTLESPPAQGAHYGQVMSRPVLGLRYSDTSGALQPSAILHEFTHITQTLDRPHIDPAVVDNHSDRLIQLLNDEFEAYDMQQYVYGDDEVVSNHSSMSAAFRVELFRKYRLNGPNRMLDRSTLPTALDSSLLEGIVPQQV